MTVRDSSKTGIPKGVINRLPLYYRYLAELRKQEVEKVSSSELGEALGLTAAQIRSDLSYFGSFGQHGYGYRVDQLYLQISNILGLDRPYNLLLIGAGNLGRAIASYQNIRNRGFEIKAIFDNDPLLEGKFLSGCIIQPIDKLKEYLSLNKVDIGIITTPREVAQDVCNQMVAGGVKAIWNFAPIRLQVPEDVLLEHIHFTNSLLRLSFKMKHADKIRD